MYNLINLNEKIFVAGHKGMVGNSIIKALRKKGYCQEKNGGRLLTQSKEELDLCSYEKVMNYFSKNKPSVVILSAAKVGGIFANSNYPFDFISENLKIQQNVIEAAWKNKTKRFLFLGSSCIYPKEPKIPIKEEELLQSQLEKTNQSYAIAKIAGLKLCEALRKQHQFDAITLMPSNLYGPGDNYHDNDSHVMASLIKKFILAKRDHKEYVNCWGSGQPLREFLYVDDLAMACIHVLEKWNPDSLDSPRNDIGDKLYHLNVGSDEEISIKELAQKIAKLIKFEGKIIWDKTKPDGTFRKKLNSSRIKSLGWSPKISLNDGIKKVIEEINNSLNNENDRGLSLKNFLK